MNTKLNHQQIVQGTAMAKDFARNARVYDLFSFEDYIDFIIRFIEKLNPSFIIE